MKVYAWCAAWGLFTAIVIGPALDLSTTGVVLLALVGGMA